MTFAERLSLFTPLDAVAVALLLGAMGLIGWLTDHPPRGWPSVAMLMNDYRREWMRQFVTRQPRIFDANVIDSLRQGTSFYASACMIAVGGGLALVGNSERLLGVAQDLTMTDAPAIVWEMKLILVVLLTANAFLKFVWAHRLFGYCALIMAAVPNDPAHPLAFPRAEEAAALNITAGRGFNRGLRSVYFAIAALGWLLGPVALMVTTAMVSATLLRREFASASRAVLLSAQGPRGAAPPHDPADDA